jgi:hypothetical protein
MRSRSIKQELSLYKRDGFPADEISAHQELFRKWAKEPKRKKGKQGQVKNPEKDGRTKPKLIPLPKQVRERLGRSDNESE